MPRTYDWAKARRNPYAAEYTEAERLEFHRVAAAHDMHTWIVHGLAQVQTLEAVLFSYLLLADGVPAEQARVRAAEAVNAVPGLTLTRLMEDLQARGIPGERWRAVLSSLAQERAWLLSRCGYESHAALQDADHRERMLSRLEKIARDARSLTAQVERAMSDTLRSAGLTTRQINARRRQAAELWLAA